MHASGVTAMAEAGAVLELIKGAGRWGSTTFEFWTLTKNKTKNPHPPFPLI